MWFCLTITVGLLALSSSTLSSGPIQASTLRLRHVFHRSATDGEEGREGGGVFLRADIPRVLKNDHQMLFNTDFLRRKAIPNIPPPLGPYLVQHKEGSFPTRPVNHEDNGDGGSSAGALRFQQQMSAADFLTHTLVAVSPLPSHSLHRNMRMPDPTDPQTVLALAQMTLNAYWEPDKRTWIDIPGWNMSTKFGWERDGIRGYVFVDERSEVMVITVKGTSPTWIGGGPTTGRDKFNDNMMFSCCCAYVDRSWKPICDCAKSTSSCNQDCVEKKSNFADSYFNMAQTIYLAISSMYPRTSIWITGHSLGGALASLLALTNSIPAFAYEAPGDLLFAERLGLLPKAPQSVIEKSYLNVDGESRKKLSRDHRNYDDFLSTLPIYHFGNTGDPIYLGLCNGISSTCYWGGYALETKCHVGKRCVYDPDNPPKGAQGADEIEEERDDFLHSTTPVSPLSTKMRSKKWYYRISSKTDIRYHSIEYMIGTFLQQWKVVPECEVEKGCEDCGNWGFNDE